MQLIVVLKELLQVHKSANSRGGWTLGSVCVLCICFKSMLDSDQYGSRILSIAMNVLSAKFGVSAKGLFYHCTVGVPEAVAIVKKMWN